jgi:hypothetical protein
LITELSPKIIGEEIMRLLNLVISISFILLCGLIFMASISLGVGEFKNPGPGFVPFLVSVLLFFLSFTITVKEVRSTGENLRINEKNLPKLIVLVFGLFGFTFLLSLSGYLIATFLIMFLMLVLYDPKKWRRYLIIAAALANASFFFFVKLLQVQLPAGTFHLVW